MKINKIFGMFAAAAAMLAAGCAADVTEDIAPAASGSGEATTTVVFTASCGDVARNTLDAETLKVYWASGDRIKVNGAAASAITIAEDGKHAEFTVELTDEQNTAPYKAIYPASKWTPATESTADKFAFESRYLIPEGAGIFYPMIAYSEENGTNLSFKHLTGLVKLQLVKGNDADKVCTVLVKGNNGEQVAGGFGIDWETLALTSAATVSDYNKSMSVGVYKTLPESGTVDVFIPLPAQNFEQGITVTVIDENGHFMAKRSKALNVKAGEVTTFPAFAFDTDGATDILTTLIADETGSKTITDDLYIDVDVISDAGNVNMEYNYDDAGTLDKDLSLRTSYVQRKNGEYGYRLTFNDKGSADAEFNANLTRYSHAVIALKESKITKESNPTRYTISNLKSAGKILKVTAGTASDLAVKTMSIGELTDADVYTWVSLKDVEIGINDGSYTNIHNGYAALMNTVPLAFYGKDGANIRLLTNVDTNSAWSRNGSGVPTVACTLNGIVVKTDIERFYKDGDAGRYQIRVVDGNDIVADENNAKFSTTLVEWNWNSASSTPAKNSDGTLKPDLGTGSLYSPFNTYSAGGSHCGLTTSDNGNTSNAAATFTCATNKSWWNFTENRGEAIIAKFSTSGVTDKTVMAIFDIQGGSGSAGLNNRFPSYWQVEYSTDGTTWTKASDEVITVRPMFNWNNRASMPFAASYYNDYAIELPAAVLDQPTVYVALRPSSTVCEHGLNGKRKAGDAVVNLASDDAELATDTGNVRLSTFSIRYF